MTETFCGKDCDLCQEKQSGACRGCKEGPGRRFGGNCSIADCCRDKYHANCDTCQEAMSCSKRQQKDQMPQIRIAEAAAKDEKEAQKREKAKVLGKWLWILFWLFIPNIIGNLMSNESVGGISHEVYVIGLLITNVVTVIYCLILLKLRETEEKYGRAAICMFIGVVLAVIALVISEEHVALLVLMALVAAVAGLVGEYNLFYAHAAVLEDFDLELSQKWKKLWKWELICLGCAIGGILLFFLGAIAALLIIAGGIGVFVISIVQLVYLYRMAELFREYT